MFHILLFMPRLPKSEEISRLLVAKKNYIVHRVANLREAGLLLTRQKIDLSLVAVSPNDSLVYSLNMLQENLPILLIAEVSNQYVSERQRKMAWGIVTYERLTEVFPELDIMNEPKSKIEEIFLPKDNQTAPSLNTKKLTQLIASTLNHYELDMILLTRKQELVGLHIHGDYSQMIRVGRYVRNNWDAKPVPGQITWFTDEKAPPRKNGRPKRFLLLTIPYESFLLTLAAGDKGTVLKMRQATRRIIKGMRNTELEPELLEEKTGASGKGVGEVVESRANLATAEFALVWKTKRSLSAVEKSELQRVLPMIGRSIGCSLSPVSMEDDYVQVLSTCPPGRTSAWLVQTYKKRSLEYIKKELLIDDDPWVEGYYARPSSCPLKMSELSMYIASEAQLVSDPVTV
ncbi:MAG: hypothetical protein ACI9EW_001292 [Cellvibrionaceae bacterium]|jgi:hypothetical protein